MNNVIQPTSASFLVTEDCNLKCTYCFEEHNKNIMTKEVAKRGLEILVDGAIKNGSDEFNALIFGGEPFLNTELIGYIFEYGLELSKKKNIRFTSNIITNGTLLSDAAMDLIQKYKNKVNLGIQLSVDGIKEVQNMYRVTKDGKGSFDLVERNVEGFKYLFRDTPGNLSAHGCINKKTMPYLYENFLFFREKWGIQQIWFMPIHTEEWEESDAALYKEQLKKIADYTLAEAKKNHNMGEVMTYAPIDRCMWGDTRPDAPCGAGRNFVTFTAKGDIFPCHHFYFNDENRETIIGNVFEGIDDMKRNLFVKYSNEDMTCSQDDPDCDCYHCYRCIAENWCENGSILSQIMGYRCDLSKVEREIQVYTKGELTKMGLTDNNNYSYEKGNNPNNPACLCDLGAPKINSNQENHVCNCKNNDESSEVIASALKLIIEKLDYIEKVQEILLKKVL